MRKSKKTKKTVKIKCVKEMEKMEKIKNPSFDIDRDQEDIDVDNYQKTNNVLILEKVHKARISTLQFWASHYYYLMDNSVEDMFAEFEERFMKAINHYNKKRGHFNTCLYTFIRNCIRNLVTKKHGLKRWPVGAKFDFNNGFLVSLDKEHQGKDGSKSTIMESVESQVEDCKPPSRKMSLKETINILSHNNDKIKGYLKKISSGYTLASIIKECKTITGSIRINKKQCKKLNNKKGIVKLIKTKNNIDDKFLLLDYEICKPLRVNYKIEMRKSKDADLFMKTLRKLRKNSNYYLEALER